MAQVELTGSSPTRRTRRMNKQCARAFPDRQAEYRLKQLVHAGRLLLVGKGHGAHYVTAG